MDGSIFDAKNGMQIGFLKDGFAYDASGKSIFRVDGINLLDLTTGDVVCHLTPAGLANTPGHELEGNAGARLLDFLEIGLVDLTKGCKVRSLSTR